MKCESEEAAARGGRRKASERQMPTQNKQQTNNKNEQQTNNKNKRNLTPRRTSFDFKSPFQRYSAVSAAVMVISAPKTFRLGNIAHLKKRLENSALAFNSCGMLYRLRCCLDVLKMARYGGLQMENATFCGEQLVKSAIMGRKPPVEAYRIMHASLLVATQKYAKRCGIAVDSSLENECARLMRNNFEAGASIDVISKNNLVVGLLCMIEVGGKVVPPGHSMAKEILEKCVRHSEPLVGSDLKFVQAVLDDLWKNMEEEEETSGLMTIQCAYVAVEEYVAEECIEWTIKAAEKLIGVIDEHGRRSSYADHDEEEEEKSWESENSDTDDDDSEDECEDDDDQGQGGDDRRGSSVTSTNKIKRARLKRWKERGFEFLSISADKQDKFNKLNNVTSMIRASGEKAAKEKTESAEDDVNGVKEKEDGDKKEKCNETAAGEKSSNSSGGATRPQLKGAKVGATEKPSPGRDDVDNEIAVSSPLNATSEIDGKEKFSTSAGKDSKVSEEKTKSRKVYLLGGKANNPSTTDGIKKKVTAGRKNEAPDSGEGKAKEVGPQQKKKVKNLGREGERAQQEEGVSDGSTSRAVTASEGKGSRRVNGAGRNVQTPSTNSVAAANDEETTGEKKTETEKENNDGGKDKEGDMGKVGGRDNERVSAEDSVGDGDKDSNKDSSKDIDKEKGTILSKEKEGREDRIKKKASQRNTDLLLDSSIEVELRKRIRDWCSHALEESDSLLCGDLSAVWKKVKKIVSRKEEQNVDKELLKIRKEADGLEELRGRVTEIFGQKGSKTDWKTAVEVSAATNKEGDLDRNVLSLQLLTLQKEEHSLADDSKGRKGGRTLGLVSNMLFTKKVGAAWKKAVQGKKELTQRNLEALLTKKVKLEMELVKLLAKEKTVILTRQQMDMKDLEESNEKIKKKLADEGASSLDAAEDDQRSIFEKLKEENAMIRTLREEIRRLKDEQLEMEGKLKMVRRGKMNEDEILMSDADRLEMERSIRKLKKTMRAFQRAIRECRDEWENMKKELGLPQAAGARKMRALLMRRKVLSNLAAKAGGGTQLKLPGQVKLGTAEEAGDIGVVVGGEAAAAAATATGAKKPKVLQLFNMGFQGRGFSFQERPITEVTAKAGKMFMRKLAKAADAQPPVVAANGSSTGGEGARSGTSQAEGYLRAQSEISATGAGMAPTKELGESADIAGEILQRGSPNAGTRASPLTRGRLLRGSSFKKAPPPKGDPNKARDLVMKTLSLRAA